MTTELPASRAVAANGAKVSIRGVSSVKKRTACWAFSAEGRVAREAGGAF